MSGHKKITDEQIRYAREVIAKRTEALRIAATYPTMGALAIQLGCTRRYLIEISKGYVRKVPHETAQPVNYEVTKSDQQVATMPGGGVPA